MYATPGCNSQEPADGEFSCGELKMILCIRGVKYVIMQSPYNTGEEGFFFANSLPLSVAGILVASLAVSDSGFVVLTSAEKSFV